MFLFLQIVYFSKSNGEFKRAFLLNRDNSQRGNPTLREIISIEIPFGRFARVYFRNDFGRGSRLN